jgi:hypothetical protein
MPTGTIPPAVADGFSRAMGESLYLPAAVVVVGLVAALLFERPRHFAAGRE